jgi:cell division septation protein DedD
MARENLIKLRKGTAATWASANPTLDVGEPGFESDTKKFKIGDGNTSWNNLKYVGLDGGNIDQTSSSSSSTPSVTATPVSPTPTRTPTASATPTPTATAVYNAGFSNFREVGQNNSFTPTAPSSSSIQLMIVAHTLGASVSVTGFTRLTNLQTSFYGWGMAVFYKTNPTAGSISWSGGQYSSAGYYEITNAPPVDSWTTSSTTGNYSLSTTINSQINDLIIGCMHKADDNDADQMGSAIGFSTYQKVYASTNTWKDLAFGFYKSVANGTSPSLGFNASSGNSGSALLLINLPNIVPIPAPTATNTPTASATPTPTASATPTPTASATPTPTATATPALINVGYAYNVLNLDYIGSINNSIYGLYYDI